MPPLKRHRPAPCKYQTLHPLLFRHLAPERDYRRIFLAGIRYDHTIQTCTKRPEDLDTLKEQSSESKASSINSHI